MADYHAVLQRTLSGFSDPKPQLREKLYERARSTIERQLKARTPAVDDATLKGELDKLEEAITSIEGGYETNAAAEPAAPIVEEHAAGQVYAATEEPTLQPADAVIAAPFAEPEVDVPLAPLPAEAAEQAVFDAAQEADSALLAPLDQVPEEVAAAFHEQVDAIPEPADELPTVGRDAAYDEIDTLSEAPHIPNEIVEAAEPVPAPQQPAERDALDDWASEFLSSQETAAASTETPPIAGTPRPEVDVSSATTAAVVDPYDDATADFTPVYENDPAADIAPVVEAANIDFPDADTEEVTIPPAAGLRPATAKRKSGGALKALIWLLMIGVLIGGGILAWLNKDSLMEVTGLDAMLSDTVTPTPVKTIPIAPDPEPVAEAEPVAPPVEEPVKSETRLTENGEVSGPDPVLPPTAEEAAETTPEAPAATEPPATPAVSQSAILYEEGGSPADNSLDQGRVIWSVVQEDVNGKQEPAIRARAEVPDRNLVLIMTLKRNADEALPASHLIELIFAVPDDFSGGAIEEINRFVLKDSEQGRGEGLVGVPAKIADGIFLIALNNLEAAVAQNETLLQQRGWIDIPMQYRTGRRALITLEKGIPGDKVFKDVFAAWAEAQG
ncbi:hypothetical protein [Ahrensia sp. R2A130]|uniref:hypothetical protein n=1 Tax=Ahrensia sp. R2A130 TaxID=744979 RepID=UPI0001E0ACC2|nr:hypothetical protein [Ahrensia sp. R2A130]EFL88689.1 putative CheA signal transduction histidine kinase [Ahrensia sp. R2A130]